ncbi:hypothetical protein PLUA15_160225 [Pseudomonas lundensis]|uniref:Secreted protein n=1 Tax=Pseudomonas lundensis TaxID=86185 RepID=A0AAX2H3R1_9PSED|nr:hypothetical protein PLUA15_160225 [Pseudomonas lundensis]
MTVGSLTDAAWASAAMLKRVACCGFCRMTSATLRSALFSSSRRPLICSSRLRTRSIYVPWGVDAKEPHANAALKGGLSYCWPDTTTSSNLHLEKMLCLLLHFSLSDALKKGICSLT